MKLLLAADAQDRAAGGPGVLDHGFIAEHTLGFEALAADLETVSWETIEQSSGLSRARDRRGDGGLSLRQERDHLLRHGDHAASARFGQCAADRQPAAAAGQYRPAGGGGLPFAGTFQRAGRTARSGSPRFPRRNCRRRSSACSALPRLGRRVTTRWRRSRRSAKGGPRR